MTCKNCGGDMIGDGYKIYLHCEYTDTNDIIEADGSPVYCVDSVEEDFDH